MKIWKKILIGITIFLLLLLMATVVGLIYLAVPTKNNNNYQEEIVRFEKTILHSSEVTSRVSPEKIKKQKQITLYSLRERSISENISKECADEMLYFDRNSIEEAYYTYEQQGHLLSLGCQQEIDQEWGEKYSEEIHSLCNYAEDLSLLSRVFNSSNEKKKLETSKELQIVCAGTYVYRQELTKYLELNLEKIDGLSRYMYLKMMDNLREQTAFQRFLKNSLEKLAVVETIIKKTNRLLFVALALEQIHDDGKLAEDLPAEQNPLWNDLIELAQSFGKEKATSQETTE